MKMLKKNKLEVIPIIYEYLNSFIKKNGKGEFTLFRQIGNDFATLKISVIRNENNND